MSDLSGVPDEVRNAIQEMIDADPEFVKKFGNPLDNADPRNWTTSERKERGLSLEERFELMEIDIEAMNAVLARLSAYMLTEEAKRIDPLSAFKDLLDKAQSQGQWGPDGETENGIRYAGSTQGADSDQLVPTANGMIKVSDIPGYKDDPNWKPSPDWIDANCTCPEHTTRRAQANYLPDSNDNGGDFPTGFYL